MSECFKVGFINGQLYLEAKDGCSRFYLCLIVFTLTDDILS